MNAVLGNGAMYTKRKIMFEFTVGTRFYYKGELCEVSECMHCMATCVFNIENYEVCKMFVCENSKRKDGVGVFFERVKESVSRE